MENKLSFYKEIFKDFSSILKKDELEKILNELEIFEDSIPESLIKKIESFTKPYPIPLFYFSIIRMIKIALDLKKELFLNYDYYYDTYQNIRKKEFKTEDENRLLNEIGEILYRMDEIDGKFKNNLFNLLQQINLQVQQSKKDDTIFLSKITPESYPIIYPLYEELIDILLMILDELKIEKGFYKLIKTFKESNP